MPVNVSCDAAEAALLADLAATFPGANPVSLRQWSGRPDHFGAVVCGEAEIEPGYAIGPYGPVDVEEYEGGALHLGFVAWAERRGWHVEVYDFGTLWLTPLADLNERVDAWKRAWADMPCTPLQPGERPF